MRLVRVVRRVEAPALVAAARLVRVVLRVPADLLVEDLHVPEARVKVHLETANAVQVSPNTAIVLPDRVPVARAARELARAATAMPRVGPANVVSASHTVSAVSANLTVNAANASPTVSVRVVHQVRVLVARAARELVRVERGLARVATVMLRVGLANVVSASHTVNVASASHTVNAVNANPTVSVRVVLQVRVLVVRVLVARAARELARAAREQARAAKIVVVRFAKSLSSGR